MMQTIEAIYDPKRGLSFSEAVEITEPVKVFITIIEPCSPVKAIEKGVAHQLLATLKAHSLPTSLRLSDADIETQIREMSDSWD